jgi:hypothetical protein
MHQRLIPFVLLVGLMTTVLVSWALAIIPRSLPSAPSRSVASTRPIPWAGPVPSDWGDFAHSTLDWHEFGWTCELLSAPTQLSRDVLREATVMSSTFTNDIELNWQTVVRAGWPWRALRHESNFDAIGASPSSWRQGLATSSTSPAAFFPRSNRLPLVPCWPELLLDWAFFSGITAFALHAIVAIRGRLRGWASCRVCGYDLRAARDRCTECGSRSPGTSA